MDKPKSATRTLDGEDLRTVEGRALTARVFKLAIAAGLPPVMIRVVATDRGGAEHVTDVVTLGYPQVANTTPH